jgi:hypothetical protein
MSKLAYVPLFTLLLIAPVLVNAQFEYVTNSDGTSVTITGYSGPDDVVIPPTLNGLSVTDIGEGAFAVSDITSVVIPNGVTNIGQSAFNPCDYLTNVVLPETLIGVGNSAFLETALTSLTIPPNLANIGDAAFNVGSSLTNVTIDFGLTDIQSNMIGGGFSSIIIPASVTNIGASGIGSAEITNIFFGGNAPTVGEFAFAIFNPPETGEIPIEYIATAYYLPGTTGWAEFTSNTFIPADPPYSTNAEFIPAVMWNPTIQASGTNFGIQNGQYGFDITAPTNLPIAIEACDDLSQSNWVVLERLTLTNGLFHFSESFQSNSPARFYRIGFP